MDRPEVFENLDRLVEVELRPAGLPMGVMPVLYAKARGDGEPLSLRIARRLLASEIERVVLVTGVVIEPLPRGEIDGPIGSAVLADALVRIGKSASVMVPAAMEAVVRQVRSRLHGGFEIVADGGVDDEDFDAAVAVERLGRNRAGQHHTIFGAPIELDPVADDLVERMNERGRLTIGFGDGGNEIGFGALYDEARAAVPGGADCGCPCGDGLVTSTAAEILFPVSVSNFGAYAVTAAVGLLADRPAVLPQTSTIADAVAGAMAEGCLDGGTFRPGFVGDDGIPFATVGAVIEVMHGIVSQAFQVSPRHA
jgi:D-glutamate cyclase